MNNEYNEKTFFKSFIEEYKKFCNDDIKTELIFQNNYNKLLENYDINKIYHHYSNQIDINDDYIKIKLGLILHMNLITYIMDDCIDDYDYCYDNDNDNDNDNYINVLI